MFVQGKTMVNLVIAEWRDTENWPYVVLSRAIRKMVYVKCQAWQCRTQDPLGAMLGWACCAKGNTITVACAVVQFLLRNRIG